MDFFSNYRPGVPLQDALKHFLLTHLKVGNMTIVCYVEPPKPNALTDEDSGKEGDDVVDIRHLPGKQLLAPAEILIGNVRVGGVGEAENDPQVPLIGPSTYVISIFSFYFSQDAQRHE